MSVRSLLEQTLVKDILKPSNRLITVNSTQQIVEACAVLASNGISAAPVWDAQDHCFKGVLDYRDVSELLLRSFSRRTGADGYGDRLSTDTELAALIRGGIVEGSSASSVADFSRHDPFVAARASDTAWSCIVNYLESGIHRVLVFDDTSQNFIGMLSQSDIITFVLSNRALLDPKWFTTKVMDLELDNSPVSMNWNGTVLDALQLMHDKEVTSLALVDSGGILRSAFSMTDIKVFHFCILLTHPIIVPCKRGAFWSS